jgi:tetratricopeptide (TPR) repeat protein
VLAVTLWQRRKPGDYELGVKNVRKAIELNPNKCIFWDNLAKALDGEERFAEAKDALIHASKCECTPEKLSKIQANIKHLNDATANKITPGESVPRSTTMYP